MIIMYVKIWYNFKLKTLLEKMQNNTWINWNTSSIFFSKNSNLKTTSATEPSKITIINFTTIKIIQLQIKNVQNEIALQQDT